MQAGFADEQPPANLLEMVRLRHRRHRVHVAQVSVAAVAVIAAGALGLHASVSGGARSGASGAGSPAAGVSTGTWPGTGPALMPPARSVNVVDSCGQQIGAQLPVGWQRQSLQAGPLWFVDLRQASTSAVKDGTARVGGFMVLVRNDTTAWVTVAGPADDYFRFLFGRNDFAEGVDAAYTIKNGETSVTFEGCPQNQVSGFAPGYTQYGGYYLMAVPRKCVTLVAWPQVGGIPYQVTFPVDGARCRPS